MISVNIEIKGSIRSWVTSEEACQLCFENCHTIYKILLENLLLFSSWESIHNNLWNSMGHIFARLAPTLWLTKDFWFIDSSWATQSIIKIVDICIIIIMADFSHYRIPIIYKVIVNAATFSKNCFVTYK